MVGTQGQREICNRTAGFRVASGLSPLPRILVFFQQRWTRLSLSGLGALLLCAGACISTAQRPANAPEVLRIVREASWNEMHSSGPPHFFRYRSFEQDAKGSTVRLVIETRDGSVARLVEKGGRPLSAADDATEVGRLKNLLANPDIQKQRQKRAHENDNREDELVRMLPDAFLYKDEGIVQGPSGPCYRLTFKPNPNFVPPDREGEVFHGMVGELWIDQSQLRIAKIDAHLVADVNFGWGVLGKLYRGGSILEQNADVGDRHWESTALRLRLTGKILMVKSVDFSTNATYTDFHPVPSDTSYRQAVEMLLNDPISPSSSQ